MSAPKVKFVVQMQLEHQKWKKFYFHVHAEAPRKKKKKKFKKAHLTAPELRPCNMCNDFHIYQRFSWVLKFSVEHARLEPEEISNIHLHQHNKCLNTIDIH